MRSVGPVRGDISRLRPVLARQTERDQRRFGGRSPHSPVSLSPLSDGLVSPSAACGERPGHQSDGPARAHLSSDCVSAFSLSSVKDSSFIFPFSSLHLASSQGFLTWVSYCEMKRSQCHGCIKWYLRLALISERQPKTCCPVICVACLITDLSPSSCRDRPGPREKRYVSAWIFDESVSVHCTDIFLTLFSSRHLQKHTLSFTHTSQVFSPSPSHVLYAPLSSFFLLLNTHQTSHRLYVVM